MSNIPDTPETRKAYAARERKCATEGCWHKSESIYTLCNCCLSRRCIPIQPGDYRAEIEQAIAYLKSFEEPGELEKKQ